MPNGALPPGPRIAAIQSLRYMLDPYGHTERAMQEYGDPYTMPSLNGTLVMTTSSRGAQEILEGKEEDFVVGFAVDALVPLIGQASLLLQSGDRHRRERRLLSPTFHGARMRAYAPLVQDVTFREIAKWEAGSKFIAQDAMQSIGLDVIIRAVIGAQAPERTTAFRNAIRQGVSEVSPLPIFFTFLQRDFGGVGPWARFKERKRTLDRLILRQIADARRGASEEKSDVLSRLVSARYDDGSSLSDGALRDHLLTLLVAGHETTATALAWSLYELVRHPEWVERLRAAIGALGEEPDAAELASLPEVDAFNREALRLHPIVPEFFRTVKERFTLLGWEIPAGVTVAASILMIHRDPELYPDPLVFRPQRFLDRRFSPSEFAAFGGGHRHCLGAGFAMSEMNIVLATLLTHVDLSLALQRPLRTVRRHITLGAEKGVPLVVDRVLKKPAFRALYP